MSSAIMSKEILSHCLLTVSDDIKSKCSKNETLLEAVTQLGFQITDFRALSLENRSTSKEDLIKLADALTSANKSQESSTNAASNTYTLLSECKLTVSEGIKSGSFALFDAITQAGFKIIKFGPLVIEKDSVSLEDLVKLCNLLTSDNEINEISANTAVTGGASLTDRGQEQLEGASGSTAGNSSLVHKMKISESEVEDYVMKKHHFQLAGEYFKDRDWKELFDKAEEINEGFCFRGKDISADEYHLFYNLKKIAFETIGISDNEAHRVKEAAEHINCVHNCVCVIDYGSTPYLVGPKAQVHAAKEEILCRLKKDSVDCQLALSERETYSQHKEDENNIHVTLSETLFMEEYPDRCKKDCQINGSLKPKDEDSNNEDDKDKRRTSHHAQKTPDLETRVNEHKHGEKHEMVRAYMNIGGRNKKQSKQDADEVNKNRSKEKPPPVTGHDVVDQREIAMSLSNESDSEVSKSNNQSIEIDDISDGKSARKSSDKDSRHSGGTFESGATLRCSTDSNNSDARLKSRLEEMCSLESYERVLLKSQTTVTAKKNTRPSCADTGLQQTDTKVLEGEKSSDEKEKWMKGETEGHAGDNKSPVKLISDQLKCEESDVTSLENVPKVTPKFAPPQKVASKLNAIPKLQETVEDGNNYNNLNFLCSKRMMQSGVKAEGQSFSISSDGARPKNIEVPKSTNPFDLSYRKENKSGLKAEDDSFSIPSDGARPKIFDVLRSKSYFDLTDLSYRKENQSSVKAEEDSFSISGEGARPKTVEVPRSTRPFGGRYRRESQFSVKAEDDSSSVSSDGARPKNTDLPRCVSHFDLTDLSYRREGTFRSSYSRYKPWLPDVKPDFSTPRGLSRVLSPSLQKLSRGPSTDGASLRQARYAKQAAAQYTGQSNIKVHIQKANITTLKVDCIANATTTKLDFGGRVAQVISSAAGKELQESCKRFIAAGNTVPVTGVFVSPGGRLPAKHVLHAVGPRWGLYSDKNKCTDDLRCTVLRCLVEAMRLGLSSIALPSIGAGNSNIPKELCARSYMEAVKSFDAIFGQDKDCTLKEIHFVDIADIMVNHIQESFMKYWGEPCNSLMKNLDETFSRNHLRSKSPNPKFGVLLASRGPESRRQRSKGSRHSATLPVKPFYGINLKHGERNADYQIRGIRFCISSIPALNFHMTPVITIGKEFDKLSGIQDYNVKANCKKCDDYTSQKKAYTYKYLSKPGGKQQRLVCRLYPKPKSPKDIELAALRLDLALRMSSVKGKATKDVTSCVLTSCILYAEPNNKKTLFKGRGLQLDLTLVEGFANNVLKFLEKVSQDPTCMLKRVVITASDDACPHLIKVFESSVFVRKAGI